MDLEFDLGERKEPQKPQLHHVFSCPCGWTLIVHSGVGSLWQGKKIMSILIQSEIAWSNHPCMAIIVGRREAELI